MTKTKHVFNSSMQFKQISLIQISKQELILFLGKIMLKLPLSLVVCCSSEEYVQLLISRQKNPLTCSNLLVSIIQ